MAKWVKEAGPTESEVKEVEEAFDAPVIETSKYKLCTMQTWNLHSFHIESSKNHDIYSNTQIPLLHSPHLRS